MKATDQLVYPPSWTGSKKHTYQVGTHANGTVATATVDFEGVKKVEMAFILSSESLSLMDKCERIKTAREATGKSMTRTPAQPGNSKLMQLQNAVLSKVGAALSVADSAVYHNFLFVHNNYGYRFVATVQHPARRIVYDTILSSWYGDASHATTRLAIA